MRRRGKGSVCLLTQWTQIVLRSLLQGYSLGFNNDHLFDVLSRLEMGKIQKGEDPRALDVTYIFCKQLFAPWENLDDDPVGIDLTYEQIINGMSILFPSSQNPIDRHVSSQVSARIFIPSIQR